MAVVNPELVVVDRGQDATVTVTLSSTVDLSSWQVRADFRAYNGATPFASKTSGAGITTSYDGTNKIQSWVISLAAADLSQPGGGYEWEFLRTDSGQAYKIVERSGFVIRDDAAGGSPTLTNLSEYFIHSLGGNTPPDADAIKYQQLLYAAEDHLKRWTQRDFVYRQTVTEYYDGSGTQNIALRRTPIAANGIVSVKLDHTGAAGNTPGSFDDSTLLVVGTDYFLDCDSLFGDSMSYAGMLKRIDSVWPLRRHRPQDHLAYGLEKLPGCIQVVYAAGYQLIPYALKRAVWDLTTFLALSSPWGRIPTSESGEGYSRSFGSWEEEMKNIASVASFIAPFQRLYPG